MFGLVLSGVLLTMACPIKSIDSELSAVMHEIQVQQDATCVIPLPHKFTVRIMPNAFMSEDTLGTCWKTPLGASIWINRKHWDELDNTGKFQLVAHEYAHCVLDKDHVQDYTNYMYPIFVEMFYTDIAKQLKKDAKEYCDRKRLEALLSKNSRLIK